MKRFKDLDFKNHFRKDSKIARMNFENGYGVSVLIGVDFYSNGIDSYELAVLYNDDITYNSGITENVEGYLSKEEVTKFMCRIQEL